MTDSKELRKLIQDSGLKYKFIAAKLGISTTALQKKIDNLIPFKAPEINIMCEVLHITSLQKKDNIFFKKTVDK